MSGRPSLSPCSDANPVLWALFCNVTGRDRAAANNDHWTEQDVYNWARDWIVRGRVAELALKTDALMGEANKKIPELKR